MSGMVMTVLEARVPQEQWDALKRTFEGGRGGMPAPMVEMFLVQSTADPTLWRAISTWKSLEALREYQRSTETPGGVLMFRAVGAEPSLSLFEVAIQGDGPARGA